MKKVKLLSAAIAALLITGAAGVALAAAGKDDEASDARVHLQMRRRAARGARGRTPARSRSSGVRRIFGLTQAKRAGASSVSPHRYVAPSASRSRPCAAQDGRRLEIV